MPLGEEGGRGVSLSESPILVYVMEYYFPPCSRFIKRLCNFYKPSNHIYSHIVYSEANSKRYSSVGQKLVKYLCRVQEVYKYSYMSSYTKLSL